MSRKPKFEPTEKDINYILNFSTGKNAQTDKEIAEHLGCSIPYVRKIRKKHNIVKGSKPVDVEKIAQKEIKKGIQAGITAIDDVPTKNLKLSQIKEIHKHLYKNSNQYKELEEMFSENEIEYYLEEFSAMIAEVKQQGGSLTTSEMRNLDMFIQLTIRRNRLLKEEKVVKNAIDKIFQNCDGNILDMEDDDKSTLFQLQNSIKDVNRNLKEITEQSIKVQTALDMTRQERVKRMADSQQGVLKIIQTMQDDAERSRIERQASLMEKSMKKVREEWEDEGLIFSVESLERQKNEKQEEDKGDE